MRVPVVWLAAAIGAGASMTAYLGTVPYSDPSGTIRNDQHIHQTLKELDPWFKEQYRLAQRRNPMLGKQITVAFSILPNGEVTACRTLSSDLRDTALEESLVNRVCRIRFPALLSKDGEQVEVKYRVDFMGTSNK